MIRSTTILCVRKDGQVAMAGDGQVSMNNTVLKHHARKVRKVYRDQVLTGFAGAAADAFTLFARFEAKLEEYRGSLTRAAANSIASGSPSRRAQISTMAWALALVSWKSDLTACALCTKSATAA